jgi:alanine dehydrogenase
MSEIRVLSEGDVEELLDLDALLDVVEEAFVEQHRGNTERPDRPHFPVGTGLAADAPGEPLGTGLVMPAYIHGASYYATKLVGVFDGYADRGLPTVNAQVALTDAEAGLPAGYLAGTRLTNARTGCIGGLAARELATDREAVRLGVIGAGTQARWQTRAIAAATDLEAVWVYSPSDSRHRCAEDLDSELDVPVEAAGSPREAIEGATVVVTATTATDPVVPGEALAPGTTVIAIGAYTDEMRELDGETVERAARILADVPEEAIETGDLRESGLDASDLTSLGAVLDGAMGREGSEAIVVLESVGTAVLDAAVGEHLYDLAKREGVGTTVSL